MAKKKKNLRELIESLGGWFELDLSAAAHAGKLRCAYEVSEHVERVRDVFASGRHVVVSGEAGVGKTAVVHELMRRSVATGEATFDGKAVLQLSLRAGRAALRRPKDLAFKAQELVDRLIDGASSIVPFIRDVHLGYALDLEPQLERLLQGFSGPVLTEGQTERLAAMLDYSSELERQLVSIVVPEPDTDRVHRILEQWAAARAAGGIEIKETARRAAVDLCTRFSTSASMPREPIELLEQVLGFIGERRYVTRLDVVDRMVEACAVPRLLVDPRVPFDPDAVTAELGRQVVEQDEAVTAVVQTMSAVKTGLSDARRPCGAFLFVGPTGVGKTHVAQSVAEQLFGSRERLIRFNMADFASPDDARVLFGNPHAYGLRAQRGELSVRLAGKRCAVLLLDEFEKAHERVRDRFLQLFDEGRFINGLGEGVSYRSLIVIATSNAGAEVYRNGPLGFSRGAKQLEEELERRLLQQFRFELLNRFDRIVHFRPLSRAGIFELARREVTALERRSGLTERGVEVHTTDEAAAWLGHHGYDSQFGARFLRRTIEQHVTAALSRLLLTETVPLNSRVEIALEGGRVCARVSKGSAFRLRAGSSNGRKRGGSLVQQPER